MLSILLVSPDRHFFSALASKGITQAKLILTRADTGENALVMAAGYPYSLVVADEQLPDMGGLAFIEKVVMMNPMINCAVVSRLDEDAFHEASEGLGILMQLPPDPDKLQAMVLMERLENILFLSTSTG